MWWSISARSRKAWCRSRKFLDQEGKPTFQPGDEIDVMRDKGETEEGYINLSHQKAQRLRAWDEIEKRLQREEADQGHGGGADQGRVDG